MNNETNDYKVHWKKWKIRIRLVEFDGAIGFYGRNYWKIIWKNVIYYIDAHDAGVICNADDTVSAYGFMYNIVPILFVGFIIPVVSVIL